MTAAEIDSALATHKTVRITYFRSTMLYQVDVMIGDDAVDYITTTPNEDLAEGYAHGAARALGLDITRKDVP